jgi:hypothetical protein
VIAWHLLIGAFVGWLQGEHRNVIEYLREENRVLLVLEPADKKRDEHVQRNHASSLRQQPGDVFGHYAIVNSFLLDDFCALLSRVGAVTRRAAHLEVLALRHQLQGATGGPPMEFFTGTPRTRPIA